MPLGRLIVAALALCLTVAPAAPAQTDVEALIDQAKREAGNLPASESALDRTLAALAPAAARSGPAQRLFKERLTAGSTQEKRAFLHALGALDSLPDALKPDVLSGLKSDQLLVQLAAVRPALRVPAYRGSAAGLARSAITQDAPLIERGFFAVGQVGGDPSLAFVQGFSRLNPVRAVPERLLGEAAYDPRGTRQLLIRRLSSDTWWHRVNAAAGLEELPGLTGSAMQALADARGTEVAEADFAIYRAIAKRATVANGGFDRLERALDSDAAHDRLGALYGLSHAAAGAPPALLEAVRAVDPETDALAIQRQRALDALGR